MLVPLKLIGFAMFALFGATFNLHGYTCQTTVIFGKLKDGIVIVYHETIVSAIQKLWPKEYQELYGYS